MIILPAVSTALILIDLQKGIVGMPTAPYSGDAVLTKGKELARRFRAARAPVALKTPVDRLPALPPGGLPEGYLATSPGGVDAAAIIAASTNVDTPFVMAMQTVRMIVLLLVGPHIARWTASTLEPRVGNSEPAAPLDQGD
jgi:hypothetical protein